MNRLLARLVVALTAFLLPLLAGAQRQSQEPAFVENKGQWPAIVLYQAQLPGLNVWITKSGVTYDYFKAVATGQSALSTSARAEGHVVRFSFLNGSERPSAYGTHKLSGSINFIAASSNGRKGCQAARYAEIMVAGIYPGVSQRWYFESGQLRYDFLLDAGADPGMIKLKMEGAEHAAVTTGGELKFDTRFGEVRQAQLLAYQQLSGHTVQVGCKFRLQPGNLLTYEVSNANHKYPLVIDPVIYSTFVGGNGTEEMGSHGMTIDAAGNVYVCGRTTSLDFPATPGAYNSVNQINNAFVTKINPSGNSLIYSTFVGAGNCGAIAVDAAGNVYIAGESYGTWPITSGAYNANTGSSYPSFLTKLNSTGTALIYSSYIGQGMTSRDIKVDAMGNAYVTGTVSSLTGLAATFGAYDVSYNSGTDGFVMKMNPSGSARVYATFLGGNAEDYCHGLAIDASGNAYITGRTNATNFPVTAGAYQTLFHPGYEAFITKLNPTGTALTYSTFVGGSGDDRAFGLAMDASENVTITGWTTSSDFPVTAGVYQPALSAGPPGNTDAFVFKLNAAGTTAVYSTYLGGPFNEFAQDIALDPSGAAVICGWTRHAGFPITAGSLRKPDITTTDFDAFVSRLNTTGTALTYSTLLGSSGNDDAKTIKIDNAGNGYVFGGTNAHDFFTTPGTLDSVYAAGNTAPDGEAFLTKLDFVACNAAAFGTASANTDTLCKDDLLQLSAVGGYKYRWRGPQGWLTGYSDTAAVSFTPNYGGAFVVTVFASNGCTEDDTVRIVYDAPGVPVIVRTGDTLSVFFNTAARYQWYLNGSPVPGATNSKLVPSQNGSYTVMAISASGCTAESSPFNMTNVAVPTGVSVRRVTAYPNPFDAFIKIDGTQEPMELQLTDLNGRVLAEGNQQLKTDAVPAGMYFLQVRDRKGAIVQRKKMVRR